jgi:hypothetical protein
MTVDEALDLSKAHANDIADHQHHCGRETSVLEGDDGTVMTSVCGCGCVVRSAVMARTFMHPAADHSHYHHDPDERR